MNLLTDVLRMFSRREVVKEAAPDDSLILSKNKEPEATGVSSTLPSRTVRMIKAEDFFKSLHPVGWARYDDAQYTTAAPLTLTAGAAAVVLPNNSSFKVETYMNSEKSMYDATTQKIQMFKEGEVYQMVVAFKGRTANMSGTSVHLRLTSTGATPYDRVSKTITFAKSNSFENFYEVFSFYADADFIANGNQWKIDALGNDVEIADVIFFIQRTFTP